MSASSLVTEELQPSPSPSPPRPVYRLAVVALVLAAAVTAVMIKGALMLRDYNHDGWLATTIGVVLVVLSLYAWVPCARAFVGARERGALLAQGELVPSRRVAARAREEANISMGYAAAGLIVAGLLIFLFANSGGVASTSLSTLFSAPSIVWNAAASLVQPIFDGGRMRSQVTRAELGREQAKLEYQHTIHQAFREVADALVGYQSGREAREIQERLVHSATDARRLADMRYQGGTSSYLEVLDSDTRLFDAELGLVNAELSERTAFIEIYRALGGGWQS